MSNTTTDTREAFEQCLADAPEELGPDADEHDVLAFNAALERAWEKCKPEGYDEMAELVEQVLAGREGRGPDGLDWVQVAAKRRATS